MPAETPAALREAALALYREGRAADGMALLRQAIAQDPGHADWHNDLGNLLAALRRPDEAAAAFLAALEIDPQDAQVWNNLGAVLAQAGRDVEAIQALRNAVGLAPDCEDALNHLGDALARQGEAGEAARCHCAAYVLRPTPDKPRHMLGLAYTCLGRIDEAAAMYRAWLDAEPGNAIAAHLLAACRGEAAPQRASDAYLAAYFDGLAGDFERKLVQGLDYQVPDAMGRLLGGLGLPAHGLRVLDAGCGTGLCGPRLAPHARQLVGVDLSARSLEQAAAKGLYHTLEHGEIVAWLGTRQDAFDLLVAADTLIYFGEIDSFLRAAAGALADGGWLLLSFEVLPPGGADHAILPSGRYGQSRAYIDAALARAGFATRADQALELRKELGQPVPGLLLLAQRQARP